MFKREFGLERIAFGYVNIFIFSPYEHFNVSNFVVGNAPCCNSLSMSSPLLPKFDDGLLVLFVLLQSCQVFLWLYSLAVLIADDFIACYFSFCSKTKILGPILEIKRSAVLVLCNYVTHKKARLSVTINNRLLSFSLSCT